MAAQLVPCSLSEPCYQDGCGACYPDKVMQQETEREARAMGQLAPLLDPRERTPDVAKGAALEADRAAGYAFRKGDYSRALAWLESARQLDPDQPDLDEHFARVRAAQREAAAKVAKPRDLGEVADSFGDRTKAWLAQRDANRMEPTEKCDTPKGDKHCGELGHPYAQGRRCDDHRPKVLSDIEPGQ